MFLDWCEAVFSKSNSNIWPSTLAKAARKKVESCGVDEDFDDDFGEDDDEDLDENYDLYEGKSKPKSDKFAHKEKVAGKKPKGCCGKKGCKDCEDDELDESLEDDYPETFRRPNNVQQGTDTVD